MQASRNEKLYSLKEEETKTFFNLFLKSKGLYIDSETVFYIYIVKLKVIKNLGLRYGRLSKLQ